MPTFEITSPDGRKFRVTGPEGSTREQALAKVQGQYSEPSAAAAPEKPEYATGHNVVMGALKGASDIGATAMLPIDFALNKLGVTDKTNKERREQLKQFFEQQADPKSAAFKLSELGAQIAGTAGAPGVLAKGAQAVGAAPKIVAALQSGGFTLGGPAAKTIGGKSADMALRMGAGGAGGAAMAGMVDPEAAGTGAALGAALPPAVKVAGAVGRGIRSAGAHALGATTGTGAEAVKQSYKAGLAGSTDFLENMRGQSSLDDVLNAAKQNLDVMGKQKQAAYRAGMGNIKKDKTVLAFDDIDQAIKDASEIGKFKGQIKNAEAVEAVEQINKQVNQWKSLNPAEFHTPEGLDALKQSISGVIEKIPFEQKTARLAAGRIYDSIKGSINAQAPEYAKVMKDYSKASELIDEIQKALIGGKKATAESSMRKLQSLMRNNVNTSYGYRTKLAEELQRAGGKEIMPALAGQAMSEVMPRGIQRAITGGGAPVMALMGEPLSAAILASISSPRLVGETLYGAGRASGAVANTLAKITRGALPGQGQNVNALMQNPVIRNALIQANLATP